LPLRPRNWARTPTCLAFSPAGGRRYEDQRIEIGTAVIDMRYENPLYMAEDAGAADLIAGGRLQLGISRGSPEQVIDGWRHFGYQPAEGESDADMGRRHAEVFFDLLRGEGFAQANPRPMFPKSARVAAPGTPF
jgi:alkanesulfonate monooxygenase SsuD/methylene tetrahydromethanopterin reductase-like flavin-dependent oxidoreductase (luciferase family)